MTKKPLFLFTLAGLGCLSAAGCFTVKTEVKTPKTLNPAALAQAKNTLENKKQKAQSVKMPATLGGVISSDSWVVYQAKEEEEFKGNVFYDNGTYYFRSDYALSQRAQNKISARGNVHLKQTEKSGAYYEAFSDSGVYNYQTGKGELKGTKKKQVKLFYQSAKNETATAWADRVEFNTQAETYNLYGNVKIIRLAPQSQTTLLAQKVAARKADNYAILEGDAQIITPQYKLDAHIIEYDGKNHTSYAHGERPLATGQTEDGTFAIIADKLSADNETRKITLTGKVQGWVVSDQINKAEFNDKF